MPPSNIPNTPSPKVGYGIVGTPDVYKRHDATTNRHDRAPAWTSKRRFLVNTAQLVLFVSIFVYVFAQFFYFTSGYAALNAAIGSWYGVTPSTGGGGGGGTKQPETGHREMVRPTFFFFFTVIPIIVSLFVFEFVRHFNVRQVSSRYILKAALVLRRKPRVLGRVSSLSLGELFFLVALIGGNLYVTQYMYRARYERYMARGKPLDFDGHLTILALTFGLVSVFNMAFLFLPATRNCVWMEFLNISYANGVKYHRWVGVFTVITGLLHCAFFYWVWIRQGKFVQQALPCFDCNVGEDGRAPWMNFLGLIAIVAFVLIAVTSVPFVRRKLYNVFYYFHHLFIVAVIFSVLHWNNSILWILPTFTLYIISRSLSSSNGFTPVAVKEFTTLGDDIVKITLARSTSQAGDYKVGQFVYLNIPSISKLEWHAFTIASSPHSSSTSLTILLKSLGDWTQELVKYTKACKQDNVLPIVYMDAFYGASLEMYDEYSTVCLVGGGIGATPLFAILDDLVEKLSRGSAPVQKVHFIFTFRELTLLEELHPLLMRIKELDPQQQYFTFDFHLSQMPTNEQLDALIDHERLAERHHIVATQYDTTASKSKPVPFAAPLRSTARKSSMYLAVFFAICLSLTVIKYGQKIQASHPNLWPLQNFVEITMVFVVVALVAFAFIIGERKFRTVSSPVTTLQTPTADYMYSSDVRSFRELVFEYNVKIGQRPDMVEAMSRVLGGHTRFMSTHPNHGNGVVGVFISGPTALKILTEHAIAELGPAHFDLHEEQFEL